MLIVCATIGAFWLMLPEIWAGTATASSAAQNAIGRGFIGFSGGSGERAASLRPWSRGRWPKTAAPRRSTLARARRARMIAAAGQPLGETPDEARLEASRRPVRAHRRPAVTAP